MSLKKIDANIRLITTNAGKLNARIHDTAVMIASHAAEHGDCTRAQLLVNAMPASMRRSMLKLWFDTFTPIVTKINDPKWTAKMRKADDKGFVAFDVAAGTAKPFYDLARERPETDTTLADVNKAVESLIKRLTKRVEEGKVAANDKAAIEGRIAALKAVAA